MTTASIAQSTSSCRATVDIVCTAFAMIDTATSIAIAITTMHIDQQSVFAINAPIEIESMVVATISHKMGYKKSRSNSKVLSPIHSFLDKQAKHTWVECSTNVDNQTNPTLQRAMDTHHAAINKCYHSNDDRSGMDSSPTGAVDDNGSVNRCLFSNNNNNFATFLDPPLPAHKKKFAEKNIEHREKLAKKSG